jgi:small subunit ribosomal protein S20
MATTIQPKRKGKKKSVLKRIRQTERRTAVNRIRRGDLRAQVKQFRQAVAAGDVAKARGLLPSTLSILDRSAQKGILHPNTAARTKSRLLLGYNALLKKQGAAAPGSAG